MVSPVAVLPPDGILNMRFKSSWTYTAKTDPDLPIQSEKQASDLYNVSNDQILFNVYYSMMHLVSGVYSTCAVNLVERKECSL